MTTYMIIDGNGDAISDGLQEHNARAIAQAKADDRGEVVWLYADGAESGEEFRPADGIFARLLPGRQFGAFEVAVWRGGTHDATTIALGIDEAGKVYEMTDDLPPEDYPSEEAVVAFLRSKFGDLPGRVIGRTWAD